MAEKKIGSRTFKTEPMLAMDSLILQGRLLKAVGPAFTKLGDILKGRGETATDAEKAASDASAIAAFSALFTGNDSPVQLAELIRDIVQVAQIKRPSGMYENCDIDGDFTGQSKDIIPVVVFVLREQYGDFFAGLPGIGSLAKLVKD